MNVFRSSNYDEIKSEANRLGNLASMLMFLGMSIQLCANWLKETPELCVIAITTALGILIWSMVIRHRAEQLTKRLLEPESPFLLETMSAKMRLDSIFFDRFHRRIWRDLFSRQDLIHVPEELNNHIAQTIHTASQGGYLRKLARQLIPDAAKFLRTQPLNRWQMHLLNEAAKSRRLLPGEVALVKELIHVEDIQN